MRIAVVGAGAVGGYFGARLARAGEQVSFLARGEKLAAMLANGVRVESVQGDFTVAPTEAPVTDDPGEIGPVDIVLFTVKSYDTVAAAQQLAPLIGPDTGVISLQNGIDNEDRLAEAIGANHVLGGVAYIFAHAGSPGVIVHTGGPTRIEFGELTGERSQRAEAFMSASRRAGFGADIADDVRIALWSKYAFICALAGLTAATRLPIGEIRESPPTWRLFEGVLDEAWRVALAEGVSLPDDYVAGRLEFARGIEADGRSSLYDDMIAGRRMELDALLGELVRRAAAVDQPAPISSILLGLLRPWQARNEHAAAVMVHHA